MKIRSLTVMVALAVIASSAMASEAVRVAAGNATSAAHPAGHDRLSLEDMQPLASVYVPTHELSPVEMPNCSDCH